jgi:hypothetical protein
VEKILAPNKKVRYDRFWISGTELDSSNGAYYKTFLKLDSSTGTDTYIKNLIFNIKTKFNQGLGTLKGRIRNGSVSTTLSKIVLDS